MEAVDSAINNYPQAETNVCPSDSSTNEKIDIPVRDLLQQYKKSELPQINITALYPEILLKIFSYLNIKDLCSIAGVCKYLREAAYSNCLWKDIEVRLNLVEGNNALFASLAERGIKKLQILSIEKHFPEIAVVLPKLESLDLSVFSKFSDNVKQGAILKISNPSQLTDKAVSQVAFQCRNLNKLYLDNCNNITDSSLMLIAWGLKKLKVLSLSGCYAITNLGIKHIVGHSYNPSSDGNRLLECLILEGCDEISDIALQYLSNGFMKHLKTINLSYCVKITDVGLKHLSKISSLRELELKSCPNITNAGIKHIAEGGCNVGPLETFPRVNVVDGMDFMEDLDDLINDYFIPHGFRVVVNKHVKEEKF